MDTNKIHVNVENLNLFLRPQRYRIARAMHVYGSSMPERQSLYIAEI